MSLEHKIHILEDVATVAQRAAAEFAALSAEAIRQRGRFSVALAGGSTPKQMYRLLAIAPLSEKINWQHIHLFWGDERCVPPEHGDSNYRMVHEALIQKIALPAANIHRMPAEYRDLNAAAGSYANELRIFFKSDSAAMPRFDLILLGMGADGHTASLFPETAALAERQRWVVANEVPQLQTHRLTLTFPVINAAAQVWFLATGAEKAEMVALAVQQKRSSRKIPAQLVQPDPGALTWFLDAAAAAQLRW
ncbi:6-phosphogluconolactonase [candidate division KSB1 bacterium]|nr:MAG: 6-phosphogluconolactonase [candidate division KSB1 bacterium]MBC6949160.1 6-phosphogluconolactonase [candidate division KSB1 bacterium]MCE7941129.1 6-phosphogluconolactonase [Chlorobi bacterium CHB1]